MGWLNTDLCETMQLITLGEATGLQLDFTLNKRQFKILTVYPSPSMDCNLFLIDLIHLVLLKLLMFQQGKLVTVNLVLTIFLPITPTAKKLHHVYLK
jgi:hypothetical protein